MKTALAGLNPGAASSASQTAAGNASAKTDASNAQEKPQFDRLMEKKATQAKSVAPAGKGDKTPVAEAEDAAEKDSAKTERNARKPKATEDWPPLGLISQIPTPSETASLTVPASPLELAANAQASLLADAELTETPAVAVSATAGGDVSIPPLGSDAVLVGAAVEPAQTTIALAADAMAPEMPTADLLSGADVPAATPAHIENSNAAKPALQNLLSFASHLAAGNAVAAAPEAIALVKDVVDALRSDDAESASPSTNLMAAPTTTSTNGLARTATVNPLEAAMPDLHNEQFDEAVGTRLTWMAEQKIGHAHIKISPNDLGTVEVRLRLDGDRVHADFSSAQPEVRQALENSLPKLREMLGQHGFQLGQADVGHHQDSRSSPGASVADRNHGEGTDAASEALLPRPVRVTAHGLLDAYA